VEVGDQRVDASEFGGRVEVERGFVEDGGRRGRIVLAEEVLDGTHAGGADSEPAAALREECGLRGCGDLVELAVDLVILDLVGLDGLEGAEADMEGYVEELRSGGGEAGVDLRGEVEAGGGCGDGDGFRAVGVDGAVAFAGERGEGGAGGGIAGDVGGQWDFADDVGHLDDRGVAGGDEGDAVAAFLVLLEDGGGEVAVVAEGRARRQLAAGAEETPPIVGTPGRLVKETLDAAPGGTLGEEAGGDDVGVVAEEGEAAADEIGKVGEDVVRDSVAGAVDDEQTRLIAASGGRLGDQLGGQFVIEERGFHRRCGWDCGRRRASRSGRAAGNQVVWWRCVEAVVGIRKTSFPPERRTRSVWKGRMRVEVSAAPGGRRHFRCRGFAGGDEVEHLGLGATTVAQGERDIEPVEKAAGIAADGLQRFAGAGGDGDALGLWGEIADEAVELRGSYRDGCAAGIGERDDQRLTRHGAEPAAARALGATLATFASRRRTAGAGTATHAAATRRWAHVATATGRRTGAVRIILSAAFAFGTLHAVAETGDPGLGYENTREELGFGGHGGLGLFARAIARWAVAGAAVEEGEGGGANQ